MEILGFKEHWTEAQASLYHDLGQQVKALWLTAKRLNAALRAPHSPLGHRSHLSHRLNIIASNTKLRSSGTGEARMSGTPTRRRMESGAEKDRRFHLKNPSRLWGNTKGPFFVARVL